MSELKELDAKGLAEKLENAQAQLNQLKLNHTISPLENPSQIKAVRRDIARMKTELRQGEIVWLSFSWLSWAFAFSSFSANPLASSSFSSDIFIA